MGKKCCVYKCRMRSEKHKEIKFYRFPIQETRRTTFIKLSGDRQRAWLEVINRKDMKPESLKNRHVCSKHFISGRSSGLKDFLNVDWIPTQNMGYLIKLDKLHKIHRRYIPSENQNTIKPIQTVENTSSYIKDEAVRFKDISCQTDDLSYKEYCDEALNRENERLTKEIEGLKGFINITQKLKRINLSYKSLKNNDNLTNNLTGFSTFSTLHIVFNKIQHLLPSTTSGKINKFNIFLMTLMKMRWDLPFSYLGPKYQLTTELISELFHQSIRVLYNELEPFANFGDQNAAQINRLTAFDIFGNRVAIIIDCYEVFSKLEKYKDFLQNQTT